MRTRVLVVLGLVVAACGGKLITNTKTTGRPNAGGSVRGAPDLPDAAASIASQAKPQPEDDGSSCPLGTTRESYVAPGSCLAAETNIVGTAASVEQLEDLLLGQWLLCSSTSVFSTKDEIGLELAANGQWFKLYPDGNGSVTRGQGSDSQGSFEAVDVGDSVHLNLVFASGAHVISVPSFSASPRKMRLSYSRLPDADYIFNDSAGRCASGTSAPPPGKYTPPASCAQSPRPEPQPRGVDRVRIAISGRWALCNTPSTFGTSDEAGLEITRAGEFFKLYVNQAGDWVRGQGFGKQGTYSLDDLGSHVQLNLDIAGSGSVITSPQIGSSPRALRLNNNGVFEGRYVRIER